MRRIFPRRKVRVPFVTAVCDSLHIPSADLCVLQPLNMLRQDGLLEYCAFDEFQLPPGDFWRYSDILMVMRGASSSVLNHIRNARRAGKRVIYMTDDDIGALGQIHGSNITLTKYYSDLGAFENIPAMIIEADDVVVFSQGLCEALSSVRADIRVFPALSGIKSVLGSSRVFFDPDLCADEMRIGYAGTSTHAADVALVEQVLAVLLDRFEFLYVESIGQILSQVHSHRRYRPHPAVAGLGKFGEFISARNWDIGLAPLRADRFNNSKSDNKYRTYGTLGIPGVYSNRPPFSGSVRHGYTGLLASDDFESWFLQVTRLMDNASLRKRIRKNALIDVNHRYGRATVLMHYAKLFDL